MLLFWACNAHSLAVANDTRLPVIAVVEDYAHTETVKPVPRTTYEPRIRGLFFKHANGWKTMCDDDEDGTVDKCPSENVRHFAKLFTFSSLHRFEVKTSGLLKRKSCCGKDVGWLKVADFGHIDQQGDRLREYSGMGGRDPVFKPKPLTNRAQRISGPEAWKMTKHRPDLTQKTWGQLASLVDELQVCAVSFSGGKAISPISVPWNNAHIEFQQQFVNRQGQVLVQARPSPAFFSDCKRQGGEEQDGSLFLPEFWLAFAPGSDAVIHLFKFQIGFFKLNLPQFGDFDGDGKTEALLMLSGYNRDGYVLFHDNMTQQIKFVWGYH